MIETSTEITNLTAALFQFQGNVGGVLRDAQNPHFRNRYATLENVIETAKPALQEAGLAFTQAPGQIVDGAVEVTTMLVHTSGQWMRSTLHVPLGKRDAQGVGSAITYGCRYSLMATLGLPPTDDDGEAASQPADKPLNLPAKRETGFRSDGSKTAHALKKEGSWESLMGELQSDFADCHSTIALAKLRADYRGKARDLKWPREWLDLLAQEFDQQEQALQKMEEVAA